LKRNKAENSQPNSPYNFFYIWNYLEWGGAQILFFGLMKEAQKIGKVKAIMPEGSNEQLLKFLDNINIPYNFFNAHLNTTPAIGISGKIKRHLNKIFCEFKLLTYLGRYNFEKSVIHTELAPWQSLLALLWLCRKAPVFVTMHNSLPPVPKWRFALWKLKFWVLARNKKFNLFTANINTKESLRPLVPNNFYNKITVIYANVNCLEIEQSKTTATESEKTAKKFNLQTNKFLVFCVGQFIDRKGRWIFLEAARQLSEESDDFAFVWISNSKPSIKDLEKVKSYNLSAKFLLITSDQIGTEHVDLFKLLRQADVFALPSYVEGLPISILESMALGIPTISTNINAIPEAIKHLETGLLIEPGNSGALKDSILLLKNNSSLREKLSIQGEKYILENFDETKIAKIAVERYIESFKK